MTVVAKTRLRVADEVWIATALLHREHPERTDFTIEEIVARAKRESLCGYLRPSVYVHVVQHCVANRPANPGRSRMLIEPNAGRRRLFREGDAYHPSREGSRTAPERSAMPYGYNGLLSWYRDWCAVAARSARDVDPLLSLAGSGKRLWADEHADDYLRRLRKGWE